MEQLAAEPAAPESTREPFSVTILNSMPDPILVVDEGDRILYVNNATEQLFRLSAGSLVDAVLPDVIPRDSPMLLLVERVRNSGSTMSQHGLRIDLPRVGELIVSVNAAPLADYPGHLVLSLKHQSIAGKIDGLITHRNSARSITAMSTMLAHEIKNPLSGVRGAAQLLEQTADGEDRQLTSLIIEECDRIVALIDRMEVFTGEPGVEDRSAVNIHEVLDRVLALGRTGFAKGIRIKELYDPSLPPVYGYKDGLIQAFLNLVKNAAEAAGEGGEIVVTTSFVHGVHMASVDGESPTQLPLLVTVQDNGPGIPDDLRQTIFDPFVTTKPGGTGLGLPLVAKLIDDHGGVIDVDSRPQRTVFRVMLPVTREAPP
jgi:two-component system nitrogen regulation sensor histidine kinase GlnL